MQRDSASQRHQMQGNPSAAGPSAPPQGSESPRSQEASGRVEMWRQVAEYSGLAVALPIATVLGYSFGRWLDASLGTSFLWLVGLLFGVASGFTQLVRKALKDSSTRPG